MGGVVYVHTPCGYAEHYLRDIIVYYVLLLGCSLLYSIMLDYCIRLC